MKSQCTSHGPINLSIKKMACARSRSRMLRRKRKGSFVIECVSFALLRASASLLGMTLRAQRGTLVISGTLKK